MNNKDKGSNLYTAFPKKIQKLVKGLVEVESYNEEYLLVSILSAVSSAAGNAVQIRIKGQWVTNSALYAIIVGETGTCKSHPLDFAYSPFRKLEKKYRDEYVSSLKEYENLVRQRKSPVVLPRPSLKRAILEDFTPEALWMSHSVNPRGMTVYVDELMGMFNSINQYSKGQLIEQFLTAYSGKPLDVARVSLDLPLHIDHPCINIIGTTQTDRIEELFRSGYEQNGLLDRFLFSFPVEAIFPFWDKHKAKKSTKEYFDDWEKILNKIISLPYDEDAEQWLELPFTTSARDCFYDWYNTNLEKIIKSDLNKRARNRLMKTNLNVARIALIIQMLRWACSEAKLTAVDLKSLKSALQISEYFEECYIRIGNFVCLKLLKPSARRLFKGVGTRFKTGDAVKVGKEMGMSERNVKYLLTTLTERNLLKKTGHGWYQKTGISTDV